jgi:pimeloyl-ACP methyl ester carboxylesterase
MTKYEAQGWPDGEVVRDGTPIHYYRTGERGKPSVVLLHGFTDFGLCWAPVAADLAAEYDVVMIDAIGHGRSGGTERGFRKRAVTDVLAVIDGLGLQRPALLGHSMGAGTAAEVAATAPATIRAGARPPRPTPRPARPTRPPIATPPSAPRPGWPGRASSRRSAPRNATHR